ncbi:MAG: hypothetical protein IPH57_06905 [Saprospiraceae bacterium]|nr:hypothetical protein [Saprospiraceae bacterium]
MSRNMLDNSFYKYPDNDESKPRLFDYYSTEAENKIRYELNFRKTKLNMSSVPVRNMQNTITIQSRMFSEMVKL